MNSEQCSLASEWNPRYLAYCAAHGHPGNPVGMLDEDKEQRPGGCMVGFMMWIQQRWNEFDKQQGIRGWQGGPPCHGPVEHMAFDEWLNELSALGK